MGYAFLALFVFTIVGALVVNHMEDKDGKPHGVDEHSGDRLKKMEAEMEAQKKRISEEYKNK